MASISAASFHVSDAGWSGSRDFYHIYFFDRSPNSITRTWVLAFRASDRRLSGCHYWQCIPVGKLHYAGILPAKITYALCAAALRDGALPVT